MCRTTHAVRAPELVSLNVVIDPVALSLAGWLPGIEKVPLRLELGLDGRGRAPLLDEAPGLLKLGVGKSGGCEDESNPDDKEGACDVGNDGFDVKLCEGVEPRDGIGVPEQ
jgi:hypothetical protein